MSEDRCVCCGEIIPEGRMVCPSCETADISERQRKGQNIMADKKNSEGYQDPTAYGAERTIEQEARAEERRQREAHAEIEKRSNQLVGVFKLFAEMADFEIIGRIHLRHKRTGKEFR